MATKKKDKKIVIFWSWENMEKFQITRGLRKFECVCVCVLKRSIVELCEAIIGST